MHSREPVLSLAVNNISRIQTVDCERLSSLWTVFTKCAEDLENGRRLENLSWRLWYRECRLLDQERPRRRSSGAAPSTMKHAKNPWQSPDTIPDLSNSVESGASSLLDGESQLPSRASEANSQRHLTVDRFHELVTQFGQDDIQRTFRAPQEKRYDHCAHVVGKHMSVATTPTSTATDVAVDYRSAPDRGSKPSSTINKAPNHEAQTGSFVRRASSVVHGFNPRPETLHENPAENAAAYSMRNSITPGLTTAAPTSMFFIESSPDASDAEDQFHPGSTARFSGQQRDSRAKSAQTSVISNTARNISYRQMIDEASGYESSPFDSEDETETAQQKLYRDSAIVSDDDDEEEENEKHERHVRYTEEDVDGQVVVDDDHIDADDDDNDVDDDDDEWDSVCSESRANSMQESNFFHKMASVDEKPILTSRKSILSTLLTNPMTRLTNAQSRSSPAISQSRRASPAETPSILDKSSQENFIQRAKAAPIKGSLSPRTTRRNMLATELSESLRRHLLWERRQKSTTNLNLAPTQLQRRHTAIDLTKLHANPRVSSSYDVLPKAEFATNNEFGYNGAGW